jgi:tRNA U34 5-carboxymethylaminomethyl modifying GTPase MnmE/TrmE
VAGLRHELLAILAELEARLDFDEDLPPLDVDQLKVAITGSCLLLCIASCCSRVPGPG